MTKAGYSLLPTYDQIDDMPALRRSTPPQEGHSNEHNELQSLQRPSDGLHTQSGSNRLPNAQANTARQPSQRACWHPSDTFSGTKLLLGLVCTIGLIGIWSLGAKVFPEDKGGSQGMISMVWIAACLASDSDARKYFKGFLQSFGAMIQRLGTDSTNDETTQSGL